MSENNEHKEAALARTRHHPAEGRVVTTVCFDAGFYGGGFELFEHWENDGQNLLLVTSDPSSIELKPGDVIVRRTWAAAGRATVYNSARTRR